MLTKYIKLLVKIISFFLPKPKNDIEKVREKLKQLKYLHLKKMYHRHLSKYPDNCKYNKTIILPNKHQINMCTFNLEDIVNVDLCYKIEHSKDCNAFCPIITKEQLRDRLIEDLKDPQKRATHYKDINILYWLYAELENEDFPENIFTRIWRRIKR